MKQPNGAARLAARRTLVRSGSGGNRLQRSSLSETPGWPARGNGTRKAVSY
jgi:hypothetical protein